MHVSIDDTTPDELVQVLLDAALERLAAAKIVLMEGEADRKRELITAVAGVVDGLQAGLDMARGGELATHLDALYRYMARRLLEANLRNDVDALDEVASLLRELQSGWQAIAATVAAEATLRRQSYGHA